MTESLRFYTCVHVRKGKHIVSAKTSFEAVTKVAIFWKLKSTAGIGAYLTGDEIVLS